MGGNGYQQSVGASIPGKVAIMLFGLSYFMLQKVIFSIGTDEPVTRSLGANYSNEFFFVVFFGGRW